MRIFAPCLSIYTSIVKWYWASINKIKYSLKNFFYCLCLEILAFIVVKSLNLNFFYLNSKFETLNVSFLISILVAAPVIEEFIFRKPFFLVIEKLKLEKFYPIILLFSCLVFSIVHSLTTLKIPVPQFILGYFTFKVGYKYGIFYSILLHFLNNAAAILISLFF